MDMVMMVKYPEFLQTEVIIILLYLWLKSCLILPVHIHKTRKWLSFLSIKGYPRVPVFRACNVFRHRAAAK